LKDQPNALAEITAARQVVGRAKARAAVEWIEQYVSTETPVLVFAHHREVLDTIETACRDRGIRLGRIDGAVSQDRRGQIVDDFQAGKLDVALLSSKAAGVGITLTRASDVISCERQWTPGDEEQCEDRCHRVGQTNPVTVRYLHVPGTVDDDMDELIETKRQVLTAVLDGGTADVDPSILSELIKRWGSRR
jgi:SWI/SNF-related matrix-associated actin-dependent regulator 1 of chromatin subfamily A